MPYDQWERDNWSFPHRRGDEPNAKTTRGAGIGRFPHRRGDEPQQVEIDAVKVDVFPTGVGMNRRRACLGEGRAAFSPQAWG